jgi:hypothetical protein
MGVAVMLSTPHPIPIFMFPAAIPLAMLATACNPEEHCRLTQLMEDVVLLQLLVVVVVLVVDLNLSDDDDDNCAILHAAALEGGPKTLPTQTSSTSCPVI